MTQNVSAFAFPTASNGVYAVTPDEPDTALLIAKVHAALEGGAGLVQYRCKLPLSPDIAAHDSPFAKYASLADFKTLQARLLLDECRSYGVPLIINDDIDLAVRLGADGVHLGKTDGHEAECRRAKNAGLLLGISCYHDINRAQWAQSQHADYVAFGRFFPSITKPNASPAPLDCLTQARHVVKLPVVAIGGITVDNAKTVINAGTRWLAVVGGLFDVSLDKSNPEEGLKEITRRVKIMRGFFQT